MIARTETSSYCGIASWKQSYEDEKTSACKNPMHDADKLPIKAVGDLASQV
jgi:hypothetical protein